VVEDGESDNEPSSGTGTYLVQRNLLVSGRRTTVRLEDEMWAAFSEVADREGCTVDDLARLIDSGKKSRQSFTSAIRVFLMLYYRNAALRPKHAETGAAVLREGS
jgi:predicted DNA-binding ribbon-helix-helix protein